MPALAFSLALAVRLAGLATVLPAAVTRSGGPPPQTLTILDDFQSYRVGGVPTRWERIDRRSTVPIDDSFIRENEFFKVSDVGGRRVLEGYTRGMSHSIVRRNGHGFRWSLRAQPFLAWAWRAEHLPAGAREDRAARNDAGLAILVTFDTDFLGRPRSIKYTYSSTLPVGATADYGRLRVIVASSGTEPLGRWLTVRRNVAADFAATFGGRMPDAPLSITLWSDSDTTNDSASGYFDDVALAAS